MRRTDARVLLSKAVNVIERQLKFRALINILYLAGVTLRTAYLTSLYLS